MFSVRLYTLVTVCVCVCVCVYMCMNARSYAVHPDGHLRWQWDRWYVGRSFPVHALTHTFSTDTCTRTVHSMCPDSRIHTVMISLATGL